MLYIKNPNTVSENVEKKISKSPINVNVWGEANGKHPLYQSSCRWLVVQNELHAP